MMKKILLTILCIVFVAASVQAQSAYHKKERCFVYMTSVGYGTGLGNIELETKTVKNKNFNVSVNQFLGYQFNNYFFMGLTAGFDFWRHCSMWSLRNLRKEAAENPSLQ